MTSRRADPSLATASDPSGPGVSAWAEADGAAGISTLTFDEALAELQATVATLEEGGLPLERTIELYERGVLLHERCARLLGDAEVRVRRLVEGAGGDPELVDETGPEPG